MNVQRLGATAFVCMLFASPMVAFSQRTIDADDSDVAAMAQKIALAHSIKIPELDDHKFNGNEKKACQKGAEFHDIGPAVGCAGAAMNIDDNSVAERILLKGCSFEEGRRFDSSPCIDLGTLYLKEKRYLEVIAVFETSYGKVEAWNSAAAGRLLADAYRALGNTDMAISELDHNCNWLDVARDCQRLKAMGVSVDMQDARQRQLDRQHREDAKAAEWAAVEAKMNEHIREVHAETKAVINETIDKTMGSIQQSQADMAQAKVNAAALKMAQQNKGAGGYPTTSSGGSSGGGSSSSSSKASSQKPSSSSSDSSDTADPQSSDTTSDKLFNPYSSTAGGYNPISGQGSASVAAGPPADKGHWIETEVTVGYANRGVPHNVGITLGLATADGNPSQYGGYVSMTNSDKNHPFFYGFAGVINERFEAGSSALIRWPAPYLAKNRDNPAFEARMSIRYWAFD